MWFDGLFVGLCRADAKLRGRRRNDGVWSIDLGSGARRLEIERTIVGESEGLVVERPTRVRFMASAKHAAATGVATFSVTPWRPKRYLARATRADLRPAALAVPADSAA